jgi:hypothetical protein
MALAAKGSVYDAGGGARQPAKAIGHDRRRRCCRLNAATDVFNVAVLVAKARIGETHGVETEDDR